MIFLGDFLINDSRLGEKDLAHQIARCGYARARRHTVWGLLANTPMPGGIARQPPHVSSCYWHGNARHRGPVEPAQQGGTVFGLWLSLVERCVRDAEAVGSNPTSPTPAALSVSPNEPSRPHYHCVHGIWSCVLPRGHSDSLVTVRPDLAGPGMERVQDDRGHGARGDRACAGHGRSRSGNYFVWVGPERENRRLVSSDRRGSSVVVRPLLFVPAGHWKGTRSFPLSTRTSA